MRPRHILLVEDDGLIADACQLRLRERGYRVDCCNTVVAARKLLADGFFDLVILEWFLPDGAGNTVLDYCQERFPTVGVIVYTSFDEANAQASISGADAVVEKSCGISSLICAVQRCLLIREKSFVSGKCVQTWYVAWLLQHFNVPDTLQRPTCVRLGGRVDWRSAEPLLKHWAGKRDVSVIDATHVADDAPLCELLYGRAAEDAAPGLLDDHPSNFVVIRNVGALPKAVWTELASAIRKGAFQRPEGTAIVPMTKLLVLVAEPGGPPTFAWNRDLGDEVDIASACDETLIRDFVRAAFEGIGRGIVDPGTLFGSPPSHVTLSILEDLVEQSAKQDAPVPALAAWISAMSLSLLDQNGSVVSLKTARERMDRHYLTLLLHKHQGKVASVVKCAGVGRQRVYQVLEKLGLSLEDFRQTSVPASEQ